MISKREDKKEEESMEMEPPPFLGRQDIGASYQIR